MLDPRGRGHLLCALWRMLKSALRWFDELPTAIQFAIVAAGIVAIAHPKTRAKLQSTWQLVKSIASPAVLQAIEDVAVQFGEATQSADAAHEDIQRSLPAPRRRSALMHARAVCLMAKGPVTVMEIERRIRAEGYISRAKDCSSYLRRVLAASDQFRQVSPGLWALKGVRKEAESPTELFAVQPERLHGWS